MCWAPGAVVPVDQAEVLRQPAERFPARTSRRLWWCHRGLPHAHWPPPAVVPVGEPEVLRQPAERSHARILVKLWFTDVILPGSSSAAPRFHTRVAASRCREQRRGLRPEPGVASGACLTTEETHAAGHGPVRSAYREQPSRKPTAGRVRCWSPSWTRRAKPKLMTCRHVGSSYTPCAVSGN